jgi:hypothetical protein
LWKLHGAAIHCAPGSGHVVFDGIDPLQAETDRGSVCDGAHPDFLRRSLHQARVDYILQKKRSRILRDILPKRVARLRWDCRQRNRYDLIGQRRRFPASGAGQQG